MEAVKDNTAEELKKLEGRKLLNFGKYDWSTQVYELVKDWQNAGLRIAVYECGVTINDPSWALDGHRVFVLRGIDKWGKEVKSGRLFSPDPDVGDQRQQIMPPKPVQATPDGTSWRRPF